MIKNLQHRIARVVFDRVYKIIRNCFGLILLHSVIGSKTRATFSTNHVQKLKPVTSQLGSTRFPAFGAGFNLGSH